MEDDLIRDVDTPILLDGGMGSELIDRGVVDRGGLWSAAALLNAPRAVFDVHKSYIDAGADWITTNTYSTIPSYLAKSDLQAEFESLADKAGRIASEAKSCADRDVAVIGSLPPLSESYRPDLVSTSDDDSKIYSRLARALIPYVDGFLCETMSTIAEAETAFRACARVLSGRNAPIYVAFTLKEAPHEGMRSGESLDDIIKFARKEQPAGIFFNCSSPESINVAINQIGPTLDIPVGGYPNRFSVVPEGWTLDNELVIERDDHLTPEVFAKLGVEALSAGACVYGGCCGIGPDHIFALRDAIDSYQREN